MFIFIKNKLYNKITKYFLTSIGAHAPPPSPPHVKFYGVREEHMLYPPLFPMLGWVGAWRITCSILLSSPCYVRWGMDRSTCSTPSSFPWWFWISLFKHP